MNVIQMNDINGLIVIKIWLIIREYMHVILLYYYISDVLKLDEVYTTVISKVIVYSDQNRKLLILIHNKVCITWNVTYWLILNKYYQ